MTFAKEELERYSRQILLGGIQAQQKLKDTRALVVGAGGLGATILPLLAATGIGTIEIFDGDTVERSNLGRQLIFRERGLGKNKAMTAAAFLMDLNPHVQVIANGRNFTALETDALEKADILLEGSDSLKTKFLLNDLAIERHKPALIAALGNLQGHAMLVTGPDNACYRCVFDEIDQRELPNCANEGIISTFPAVVAALVAHVAVEYLLQGTQASAFWVFEKNNCRKVSVQKRLDCKNHRT